MISLTMIRAAFRADEPPGLTEYREGLGSFHRRLYLANVALSRTASKRSSASVAAEFGMADLAKLAVKSRRTGQAFPVSALAPLGAGHSGAHRAAGSVSTVPRGRTAGGPWPSWLAHVSLYFG
jgi:hypothetical protein